MPIFGKPPFHFMHKRPELLFLFLLINLAPLRAQETLFIHCNQPADLADVLLPGFVDGDVYVLYLNPAPGSLLSIQPQPTQTATPMLQVMPNPAQHEVTLHWPGAGNGRIILRNMQGQVITQTTAAGASCVLALTALPAGVYVVEWTRGLSRQTARLVITE
jgi:hypothetical protein